LKYKAKKSKTYRQLTMPKILNMGRINSNVNRYNLTQPAFIRLYCHTFQLK